MGWLDRAHARLSVTTMRKHKHHFIMRCLCFPIAVGTNVFADVAATGMFEAGECVEIDHDPATHQLRVLGRTTFNTARAAGAQGHYEVVLSTRI